MYARILQRLGLVTVVVCLAVTLIGCSTLTPIASVQAKNRMTAPRPAVADNGDGVDISTVAVAEVDIVESVVAHRTQYRRSLQHLHQYYSDHGYAAKQGWAAYELDGLSKVKPFRYLMDAEVPAEKLRAAEAIAEADELYEQGRKMMKRGGHGVPGLYREDRMIQAAEIFRDMIRLHPTSDKIDDAAFLCGEIHKEYLPGQELIAVKWYERCWTWDPDTSYPARFQAAVVYDYRLHDRDAALELYHHVVNERVADEGDVRYALRRIEDLTGIDRTKQAALPVGP